MSLTITQRIILLVLVALAINTTFIAAYSEHEMEDALLDQAKKQAVVFLMGLEREIRGLPDPLGHDTLQRALANALTTHDREHLDFSPHQIYLFNAQADILAHTNPNAPKQDKLDAYHYRVLDGGEFYISDHVEYEADPAGGPDIPLVDVIVPFRLDGRIVAGLEAEIDLKETMKLAKQRDNAYEQDMILILTASAALLFLVLWWALHGMVIRHVNHFDGVTRAIAGGDLSQRVGDGLPRNELGRLGGSIDTMAASIARLLQEQEEAYLQTMQSLAKALEAKDAYTAGHSGRVTRYSVRLGQFLGLPEERLQLLKRGALMHDLGKIGIADAILNKPGPLTDEEFAVMRTHPTYTAAIMRPLNRFKEFTEIAAWHHERWDGRGYPDGIKGEEIPLLARIVAIADTWDAMTGDRVYRKGMPREKAIAILEREQDGGQWDPELMRKFLAMVREETREEV